MKLWKRVLCLILMFCIVLALPGAATDSRPFSDVAEDAWYCDTVSAVADAGLVSGYENNTFRPDDSLTWVQTVVFAVRVAQYTKGETVYGTSDPNGVHWYDMYVDYALENGLISKMAPNPNAVITRGDAAIIFCAALGDFVQINNVPNGYFTDVSYAHPACRAIYTLAEAGVCIGMGSNKFGTDSVFKRKEVATIVARMTGLVDRSVMAIEPVAPEVTDISMTITVDGRNYWLSMSAEQLIREAGTPDEILPGTEGFDWYIYGTRTYQNFLMAGVYNGVVCALCSSGPGFSYLGHSMGDAAPETKSMPSHIVRIYTDKNDGDIFHCVYLKHRTLAPQAFVDTAEALYGESKIDFHLVNAFRIYHGVSILTWSDTAARVALRHSEDMAANGYFSHTNLDGESPFTRMEAGGIRYKAAGENIIAGYGFAIKSHAGWVNSAGHRNNMLHPSFTHLGVGFTYHSDSAYDNYGTENFFTPR